jgi:DnaJ-class molecular chaperone
MNYYLILGINPDASKAEIKEAYRKMVQKYHPDHFGEDTSPFLRIQEAYQVLIDPLSRKKYDQSLLKPVSKINPTINNMPGKYAGDAEPLIPDRGTRHVDPIYLSRSFDTYSPSFEEMSEHLFKNFRQEPRAKSERLENLKVEITISSKQATSGGSLQLLVPVQLDCPLCHGTSHVGFWDCYRCDSTGIIDTEIPLIVSYPAGIQKRFSKTISLKRYGIDKFYLTVIIRVSTERD